MLFLFRWLKGYVRIVVIGDYTAWINLAVKSGETFWQLQPQKGKLTVCLSVWSFKRMRKHCRHKAFRIHILERCGLPFYTGQFRFRYGLAVGAVLYFLILFYLSSFIWVIQPAGDSSSKIAKDYENIGIKTGMRKKDFDADRDAQRFLISSNRYAFVSLNLEGCVLTVTVDPMLPEHQKTTVPGNLIARKDAVIRSFDLTAGARVSEIGSAVKKGDVLVSGIVEGQTKTEYVAASGKVYGTVKETLTVSVPQKLRQKEIAECGEKMTAIQFFHTKIPMPFSSQKKLVTETKSKNLYLFGIKLPIGKTVKRWGKESVKIIDFNAQSARAYLESRMLEKIKNATVGEQYQILDENFTTEDGCFFLSKTIEYDANIAEFKEIIVEPSN